jgi:hypothetical protein
MTEQSAPQLAKLAIAIVTHNRPEIVKETINKVLCSIPYFKTCYLIGNHPDDRANAGSEFLSIGDPRRQFISTGRILEHQGRLAESWNTAIQWAFRDPEIEWLWCMHDDVNIFPGWFDLITQRQAELYVAPFGDMCFLFSRHAFEKVGWFDERYTEIGYQDNDWFTRATWKLGEAKIVMENTFNFPGMAYLEWISVNSIGLLNYWQPRQRFTDRKGAGYGWYRSRWIDTFTDKGLDWAKASTQGPTVSDINWYPWFPIPVEELSIATTSILEELPNKMELSKRHSRQRKGDDK